MPNIPFGELSDLVRRIFVRRGMSETNAAILAANCAAAERDGTASHGLFRVPQYIASLESGSVDGHARPVLDPKAAANVVAVDAGNGFAQPALALAMRPAIEKALATGVAIVVIRNSHHLSALWLDVEPFAESGLVAFAFVNSIPHVVPAGGRRPALGTNPMAFAVPRGQAPPLVFDQASSAMAFGEVALAAKAGHLLPHGVGVDAHGEPTTDAQRVIDGGALLPFGGHKGSAIGLMVELMAAGLTGGQFSFEAGNPSPGTRTVRTGELLILIDPMGTGAKNFRVRAEELVQELLASGVTRLPGDRRHRVRARSLAEGIAVSEETLTRLNSYLGD